jgi:uncharacterized membrane protein/glutaredoxin
VKINSGINETPMGNNRLAPESKFPLLRVMTLNIAGILFCVYLLYLSFFSEAGLFCELFGTDCQSVIHSKYGRFFGLSTASLGLGYFCFHLLLPIGMKKVRPLNHGFMIRTGLVVSSFGLAFSLFYVYALMVVLDERCVACFCVHLLNIILFLQYLFLFVKVEKNPDKCYLKGFCMDAGVMAVFAVTLLISTNIVFGSNFFETKFQLEREQEKLKENLTYHEYLYGKSKQHQFDVNVGDHVIGEKGIAIHQIVLLYKDGCKHCGKAKKKLSRIVKKNENAVYLLLKNVKSLSRTQLEELKAARVPSVFVDGKMAAGWDVPGFLDKFTEDCGC